MLRRILLFPLTRIVLAILLSAAVATPIALGLRILDVPRKIRGETAAAVGIVVALLLLARFVERRRPSEVGFRLHHAGRQLLAGCALGALLLSAVAGVLAAAGWYRVTGDGDPRGGPFAFALWSLYVFAGVAIFEEVFARGVVFRVVEERLGSWAALVTSGALFGASHLGNPHASAIAAVSIAVAAGLLLGAAYMLTRTLWTAIGIHWTWNLFEGPVFGMRVSGLKTQSLLRSRTRGPELWTGGPFGPEAGLVVLLLGTALAAVLLLLARRHGRFVPRGGLRFLPGPPR